MHPIPDAHQLFKGARKKGLMFEILWKFPHMLDKCARLLLAGAGTMFVMKKKKKNYSDRGETMLQKTLKP